MPDIYIYIYLPIVYVTFPSYMFPGRSSYKIKNFYKSISHPFLSNKVNNEIGGPTCVSFTLCVMFSMVLVQLT